jgi:peptide/nickel transport system permease protein
VVERFLRRRAAVVCLVVLLLVLAVSLFGGYVAPTRYDQPSADLAQPPSWSHVMGTDGIGRDLFSRVLRGAQKSVQVALLATAVSTLVGVLLGALAGYRKGWLDEALSRLVDLALTIPVLAVLLVVASRAGRQRGNGLVIALVIAAASWPGIFRALRATFISLSARTFVEAARAAGASEARIVMRHLIPNAAGPIVVVATLTVAWATAAEASLSFLGFGASVSLGSLVELGDAASRTRPWLFYFPGLVLVLVCLCANVVGEGLRDALDPRLAGGWGAQDGRSGSRTGADVHLP